MSKSENDSNSDNEESQSYEESEGDRSNTESSNEDSDNEDKQGDKESKSSNTKNVKFEPEKLSLTNENFITINPKTKEKRNLNNFSSNHLSFGVKTQTQSVNQRTVSRLNPLSTLKGINSNLDKINTEFHKRINGNLNKTKISEIPKSSKSNLFIMEKQIINKEVSKEKEIKQLEPCREESICIKGREVNKKLILQRESEIRFDYISPSKTKQSNFLNTKNSKFNSINDLYKNSTAKELIPNVKENTESKNYLRERKDIKENNLTIFKDKERERFISYKPKDINEAMKILMN